MKLLLFIITFGAAATANGQSLTNQIVIYGATDRHIDKKSLMTNGNPPYNILHAANANATRLGIGYERTTRYGIIYGAGFTFGARKYRLNLLYDLSDFDPNAVNALAGKTIKHDFSGRTDYWGCKLTLGYRKQIQKQWSALLRIGFEERFLINGSSERKDEYTSYTDDYGTFKSINIISYNKHWGRNRTDYDKRGFGLRRRFPSSYGILDIYLGIERKTPQNAWLRTISMGLEAGRNVIIWKSDYMWLRAKYNINSLPAEYGEYRFYDNSLFIGLRVGVGLWK